MSDPTTPTFKPALILHGGAGGLSPATVPPELYARYHASLQTYLRSTHNQLKNGSSALDASVHAVSLMEDDELFNCGRGSVFTTAGTIEMEASVMVTSVRPNDDDNDPNPESARSGEETGSSSGSAMKRGAGVMRIKNVRHPIQLARECLLRTGYDEFGEPNGDGGNMHSQLVGPYVEELARNWNLEFMPDEWFWTRKRWEEHLRGLQGEEERVTMSQGTVGCVCLDQWGNLAVATSTGGMTNKVPGRVGDTPTLGAGFWAETWESEGDVDVGIDAINDRKGMAYVPQQERGGGRTTANDTNDASTTWGDMVTNARSLLGDCLPPILRSAPYASNHAHTPPDLSLASEKQSLILTQPSTPSTQRAKKTKRRAIAISGTGNGDSFLRTAAARTASAMLRFSSASTPKSLADAITAVSGPDGELQRSAGRRWGRTGEGAGGMIGIEVEVDGLIHRNGVVAGDAGRKGLRRGKVVYDYNCGGMWRAWVEEGDDGEAVEKVMVFREEPKLA